LVNLTTWHQHAYSVTPADRATLLASPAFDASVWELWPYLTAGACVDIPDEEIVRAPEQLVKWMASRGITISFLPTPLAEAVLAEPLPGALPLRILLTGGDRLHRLHGKRLPFRLANNYGPTENTVVTTWTFLPDVESEAPPSIGRPIANTRVYLLDRRLQPVPVGVPGELHIAGDGLARGYLNRPELTAEKFVPDPFSDTPGGRLYKTGDLARYLPDGNVDFLGRIDNQVQVRGFRIELGEIETALNQHPGVREAVVIVRDDIPGEKRLTAYVTASEPAPPGVGELRAFLKAILPSYMVPSAFVLLDRFPLTSAGKVDRRALPPPGHAKADAGNAAATPRNSAEEALAEIWCHVLRVDAAGIHDNFFDLGGDSILSIQIVARANQAGLRITPKDVFERPTIAELARVAGQVCAAEVPQGPVTGDVPLTPIQCWLLEHNPPDPHHWNMSMLLDLTRALDPDRLRQAASRLIEHHDALRLRFRQAARGWSQFNVGLGESVAFSVVDLSGLSSSEQRPALEAAAARLQASLDLAHGPLVRMALFEFGPNKPQRLLIVVHHLAVDGVSWRILLEDLQSGYRQLSRGEPIKLPPKTSSFKLWAERLREYARSPAQEREIDYWLAHAPLQTSTLPRDYTGGANTAASARTVSLALSEDETRALAQEIPRAFRTRIDDVLLTALARAFSAWTGHSSIFIDLEGHGREHLIENLDVSRTVGWFTSIAPIALELTSASDPIEALHSAKEQLRGIPNRGIGYGILRYLSGDASVRAKLAALPQPEVSFNYLGQFDQTLSEDGLFAWSATAAGPSRGPRGDRRHLMEIIGRIIRNRLELSWTYSENLHKRETIESLARAVMETLRTILRQARSVETAGRAPSVFPLVTLKAEELDHLRSKTDLGPADIEDIYPLSHLQQGMLFHSLFDSGAYLDQAAYTLRGRLSLSALEHSWRRAVERHPIFRTLFVWENLDEPLQIVRRQATLLWTEQDWRGLSQPQQRQRLQMFLEEERERGFALTRPPLMRLAVIRIAEEEHYLIWSRHHLLLDRWSVSLLFRELSSTYQALSQNRAFHPEPNRPYRDYIEWLRNQDPSQAEAFWRQTLKGFTMPTCVGVNASPAAASHPAVRDSRTVRLSASFTAALQSFASRRRLTMNTLVQAAWALLLSRYSGERDVVFGVTVSGRPPQLHGVESMVGLFINTLPLRLQVDPDEMLLRWLERLQARMMELREYEHTPLIRVQGWSEVPRGLPLFESILVFENTPVDPRPEEFGGSLEISAVQTNSGATNYPLTLVGLPGAELQLRIVYDCTRFESAEVSSILVDFETLLHEIAALPERRLSELPSFTAGEQQHPPIQWKNRGGDHRRLSARHPVAAESEARLAPAGSTAENVAAIWGQVLALNRIGLHENFFDLGGHSLLATSVVSRLRSLFRIDLPLRSLFENPTPAALAVEIDRLRSSEAVPEEVIVVLADLESLPEEEAERLAAEDAGTVTIKKSGFSSAQ
jgi:non-ribosomal peptide synthase protein (TIGR01720 family)